MVRSLRSRSLVLLLSSGVLVIGSCSEPSGFLDQGVPQASAGLVAEPPLRMAAIEEGLPPARLAGFINYYAPSSGTPDHELDWIRTETGPLRQIRSTIRRSGAWVRRDVTGGGGSSTEFIHLPTGITVTEVRNAAGQILGYSIRAPRQDAGTSITYAGQPTDVTEERLGERCVNHVVYAGERFRHVACVSADGISLSQHIEDLEGEIWSTSSASATRLTRRAVPSRLMQPPQFDRDAWLGDPGLDESEDRENYTVVLEGERGDVRYLMRRRQGWYAEDVRRSDGSATLWAENHDQGRSVIARLGPGARPEEVAYGTRSFTDFGTRHPEKLDRPGETVLGLSCDWYDVMPNVHDNGRLECRASDEMPLRIQTIWRGSIRDDVVATRFDRRQSATADVLPPETWSSLQAWGAPLPDR